MSAARTIYIDANSILRLLTHYSDGSVPLDAELKAAGVSRFLGRWIGLLVASEQWSGPSVESGDGLQPLHIRYEGKKVMTWDEAGKPVEWKEGAETPKRR